VLIIFALQHQETGNKMRGNPDAKLSGAPLPHLAIDTKFRIL